MADQSPRRLRALVVCREPGRRDRGAVLRAVRRSGLEPVEVRSASDAHRRLRAAAGAARGEIVVLVADVDLQGRGDGLDLAISAAFEHPPLEFVLLHTRDEDDTPDPALGIALSDVRSSVLRRPVREDVLAHAIRHAAGRAAITTSDATWRRHVEE